MKVLQLRPRKNNKKIVTKHCPMCDKDWELIISKQNGSVIDKNKGWHKRVYCDICSPKRRAITLKARAARAYRKAKEERYTLE